MVRLENTLSYVIGNLRNNSSINETSQFPLFHLRNDSMCRGCEVKQLYRGSAADIRLFAQKLKFNEIYVMF